MNQTDFDVIVLGVGGVGSAALFHLARRGFRVLGIDQFDLGHDRGSSHGETRVIRSAYFEHTDYVPLAMSSFELWRDLESTTGRSLLHPVGLLQGGAPSGEVIQGTRQSARLHDLQIESWPASVLADRCPPLRCPAEHELLFEKSAGYLLVEECVRAHAMASEQLGAQLIFGETIDDWQSHAGGCTVQTRNNLYRAKHLVLALGAGQRDLLRIESLELVVLQKHLYWYAFAPHMKWTEAMSQLPIFLFELDQDDMGHEPLSVFYGFPSLDGRTIKVARHTGGTPVWGDPFCVNRSADVGDQQLVEQFLQFRFAEIGFRLDRHSTCLYTMSPDQNFRIGVHPKHSNVFMAAGLSGHGFKFAPVIASALADLIETGRTDYPIEFLAHR